MGDWNAGAPMDRLSHKLLSCSGFACNQNGRISRRYFLHHFQHTSQRRAVADDLVDIQLAARRLLETILSWNSAASPSTLSTLSAAMPIARRVRKDTTFAPNGKSLSSASCGGESLAPGMPAKAVLIFVCPFVVLAGDCATSRYRRPPLKGRALNQNGGLVFSLELRKKPVSENVRPERVWSTEQ